MGAGVCVALDRTGWIGGQVEKTNTNNNVMFHLFQRVWGDVGQPIGVHAEDERLR